MTDGTCPPSAAARRRGAAPRCRPQADDEAEHAQQVEDPVQRADQAVRGRRHEPEADRQHQEDRGRARAAGELGRTARSAARRISARERRRRGGPGGRELLQILAQPVERFHHDDGDPTTRRSEVAARRTAAGERAPDGLADPIGFRAVESFGKEDEELALLAPHVRLEEVRERDEGGMHGVVACRRGDRVAQARELAMFLDQGRDQRAARPERREGAPLPRPRDGAAAARRGTRAPARGAMPACSPASSASDARVARGCWRKNASPSASRWSWESGTRLGWRGMAGAYASGRAGDVPPVARARSYG